MDEQQAEELSGKRATPEDSEQIGHGKRQKKEMDEIFTTFLNDWKKKATLRTAYAALREGQSMMGLCTFRITETNARLSEGFSRASCATSYHMEGNRVKTFELGSIFRNGLKVLKAFTDREIPRIPVNTMWRKALAKLLHFMYDDDEQAALFELKDQDGLEGMHALGQHLLLPLSVCDSFTIDSSYQDLQDQNVPFPCKNGERLHGTFGDTSFGCKNGWHGKADILMEDALPVECTNTSDDDPDENLSISSSTEVKSADMFRDKDIKQITAQTIVFSFLQHKYNKERMKNFLVPYIGISGKKIIAYFYDSVEDVLLATAPISLEAESHELNPYAVVFLWMTLNYKIFCTGITNEMKKFRADFFKRVDNCLDMYRNDVIRPCLPNYRSKNKKEADYGWANFILPGTEEGTDVEIEDSDFLPI